MANRLTFNQTESSKLRLHLSLILMITIGMGFLFGHLLLVLGLHSLVLRNSITIPATYLFFFGCVAVWRKIFKLPAVIKEQNLAEPKSPKATKLEDSKWWDRGNLIGDDFLASLVLVLVFVLIAVLIWAIAEAPAILSEAFFDFGLSATLIAAIRKRQNSLWYIGLFRKTIFAFLAFYIASEILLLLIHLAYPHQSTLGGTIHQIRLS